MRDKVQCQHCGLDTDANGFVCTHCGALLADQTTISQYQKPALIYRRLLFLFIALAVCLGGLAYHTESKLLIRCFVVCLGLMTLCIAQLNVATGRTHATALSSIYRNKNPVAFRIVTVLNYLVGFAAIMGGLFLGTDVVFN